MRSCPDCHGGLGSPDCKRCAGNGFIEDEDEGAWHPLGASSSSIRRNDHNLRSDQYDKNKNSEDKYEGSFAAWVGKIDRKLSTVAEQHNWIVKRLMFPSNEEYRLVFLNKNLTLVVYFHIGKRRRHHEKIDRHNGELLQLICIPQNKIGKTLRVQLACQILRKKWLTNKRFF